MTAAAFDLNPNFTGPGRPGDLLVREELADELAQYGIVSRGLEESLAARRERAIGRALVRTWEEPPDARSSYEERKALFSSGVPSGQKPKLAMDPALAHAEIQRLERCPNPNDYLDRINELRVDVLGLEPNPPYGETADPILREDQITRAEAKWKTFLALGHHGQLEAVEIEDDVEFLKKALHGPRADVTPKVRQAIKVRMATLEAK